MAWDRGAWEKKTSDGVKSGKYDSSYSEIINSSQGIQTKFTGGGLSFCPNCGSMMRPSNGIVICSKCGYSDYSSDYSRTTSRQSEFEQQQIRSQMNDVLRVMRQGKTRSQASQILDIPLSKINNWYHQGSIGSNKHTSHFYREVKYIEDDRERRKREEINLRNRIERENRERQERLRRQRQTERKIKNQMDTIISQMRNGKTRAQAASYAGVSSFKVNEWYDKGLKLKGQPYNSFYHKVRDIEKASVKTNKSKNSNFIKCTKCGRFYNSTKNISCPHCRKTQSHSKTDTTEKQMDKVLSLMEAGLSRSKACKKAGISVITVNNWYDEGSRGDSKYTDFYNKVKNIESIKTKVKVTQKTSSNNIKCSKCGKEYNKLSYSGCPHCNNSSKKSGEKDNAKYCKKCGKKIDGNNLEYCNDCEKLMESNDSGNYVFIMILILMFIMIFILSII